MGLRRYDRAGAAVYRTSQWKAVRLQAKRRDGWKCIECGSRGRLEVHHKKSIREAPDLAFDLDNLASLCGACHARITRQEVGLDTVSPARKAWANLLRKDSLPCLNP